MATVLRRSLFWRKYSFVGVYPLQRERAFGIPPQRNIFQKQRQIRLESVQSVDISRSLVARILGLSELRLEAADGAEEALHIKYLSHAKAQDLQERLLQRVSTLRAANTPESADAVSVPAEKDHEVNLAGEQQAEEGHKPERLLFKVPNLRFLPRSCSAHCCGTPGSDYLGRRYDRGVADEPPKGLGTDIAVYFSVPDSNSRFSLAAVEQLRSGSKFHGGAHPPEYFGCARRQPAYHLRIHRNAYANPVPAAYSSPQDRTAPAVEALRVVPGGGQYCGRGGKYRRFI